ncbi:S-adenosyl-L-methionine-dependent methyltransferase [Rhizophagus clarus]|uniref:S-adenosyl-L-methionine-dependent methyltransferase n=1 Tax=Rhizophagus clarus TaxID=94130 RepID=A0A8H3QZY9_9GLOM|nr:S-adenosyl-L-methionine-dependent methyltransferase [Rhizophagus clarus]
MVMTFNTSDFAAGDISSEQGINNLKNKLKVTNTEFIIIIVNIITNMGNNHSSSKRKSKKLVFYNEIDSKTTESEVEKELKYYIPNNYEDIDRIHMFHFFQRYMFQSNFSSPIEERLIQGKCKVLDIGCGPGTWLLDLANKYEKSFFYGLDNNPIYPTEIKPGNLNFLKADIFDGLPFPDNEFDFVHQDSMLFMIKADQWNFIISEMIRVTKPGGYIEFLEICCKLDGAGPVLSKIYEAHVSSCLERGVNMKIISNLDKIIKSNQNTPIVNKDEKFYVLGPNGGKIGMVKQDIYIGFHDNEVAMENLSSVLRVSKEEYKIMITKDLVEELKHTSPEFLLARFWAKKN